MTFDLREAHVETDDVVSEQVEALFERVREQPGPEEEQPKPLEITPDLIEALARQLSLAYGEDPDEQPHPLRFPRWRFHYSRAKALLAITPDEQQALATVLERAEG